MEIMKNSKPIFSIIISTYNRGQFIEEAIDSILNQNFPQEKMEIIVVDDGSIDDTALRLKKYKGRVRYIYQENAGQAGGLNSGFKESSGEILTFMDSDDYWFSNKLMQIYSIYEKYNCKAVFHDLTMVGQERDGQNFFNNNCLKNLKKIEDKVYILSKDAYRNDPVFYAITTGQSYKRDLYEKLYPIPTYYAWHADWYLFIASLVYNDICLLSLSLGAYRRHASNHSMMVNKRPEWLRRSILILESALADAKGMGRENDFMIWAIEDALLVRNFQLAKMERNLASILKNIHYIFFKKRIFGSLGYSIFRKCSLTIYLLIPRKLSSLLVKFYIKSGLINLRKKIFKDAI